MPPRRPGCRERHVRPLHQPEGLHRPRRRRLHLPGPSHLPGPRRQPRDPQLHRRHHRRPTRRSTPARRGRPTTTIRLRLQPPTARSNLRMPPRRPRRSDRHVRAPAPTRRPTPTSPTATTPSRSERPTQAANTDPTPATRSFTVDTDAAQTTINSGPTRPDHQQRSRPSPSAPRPERASNAASTAPAQRPARSHSCTSPKSYTDLADGNYTFQVRATDAASNTDPTPATRSFTVDATAPKTTIDSGPTGTTADTDPDLHLLLRRTGVDLPVQDRQRPLRSLLGAGRLPHHASTRRRPSHLHGPGHRPGIERRGFPGEPGLRGRLLAAP